MQGITGMQSHVVFHSYIFLSWKNTFLQPSSGLDYWKITMQKIYVMWIPNLRGQRRRKNWTSTCLWSLTQSTAEYCLAEEDVLLKMVFLRAELLRTCLLCSLRRKADLLQVHRTPALYWAVQVGGAGNKFDTSIPTSCFPTCFGFSAWHLTFLTEEQTTISLDSLCLILRSSARKTSSEDSNRKVINPK